MALNYCFQESTSEDSTYDPTQPCKYCSWLELLADSGFQGSREVSLITPQQNIHSPSAWLQRKVLEIALHSSTGAGLATVGRVEPFSVSSSPSNKRSRTCTRLDAYLLLTPPATSTESVCGVPSNLSFRMKPSRKRVLSLPSSRKTLARTIFPSTSYTCAWTIPTAVLICVALHRAVAELEPFSGLTFTSCKRT
ncbi:hypothetical protein OUZ56_025547 [Daphnia magna]|uniref:Uncharacterized protein n=1 Tax=Daphnia magna TaxID=35525 RepID=A0ABQ9ZKP8_9CRUS|nr:hypothetical protein OUZ56_025547 [Daphnia magna]